MWLNYAVSNNAHRPYQHEGSFNRDSGEQNIQFNNHVQAQGKDLKVSDMLHCGEA